MAATIAWVIACSVRRGAATGHDHGITAGRWPASRLGVFIEADSCTKNDGVAIGPAYLWLTSYDVRNHTGRPIERRSNTACRQCSKRATEGPVADSGSVGTWDCVRRYRDQPALYVQDYSWHC